MQLYNLAIGSEECKKVCGEAQTELVQEVNNHLV